jgi:hypothetical protein
VWRYLYDCDLDDPLLYELVIGSARGDFSGAADAIAVLARRLEPAAVADGLQQLFDRAAAGRVLVALMTDERTRTYAHLDIVARQGAIHVRGRAPSTLVEAVARRVGGARSVQAAEIPAVSLFPWT